MSAKKKMNTHIVLFRGINVGGKNKVPMAGLKECLEQLLTVCLSHQRRNKSACTESLNIFSIELCRIAILAGSSCRLRHDDARGAGVVPRNVVPVG